VPGDRKGVECLVLSNSIIRNVGTECSDMKLFLLLYMFYSVYSVYCLCVNMYCTAVTGCKPNCS
jgi:hypothetical protein